MSIPLNLRIVLLLLLLVSCKQKNKDVSPEAIQALDLKKGAVLLCGPEDKKFGTVSFETSCPDSVKADFNLAIALLHSFEYDQAEKVFAQIIHKSPDCAMAYWGVAMSNFHPLWAPPEIPELKKGTRAIAIARSIPHRSARESDYIESIAAYYTGWEKTDESLRTDHFEQAMEKLHEKYPDDKEATIFYALALDAAASPMDKTYAKQRKAGDILNAVYPGEPDHPGIVHYIIHTYDLPVLAERALPAARRYASIAPASAHAQHMPSHIFTRLGLWDESIRSNLASTAAAKCYAENANLKGHWEEELHGMDYLEYAYLQEGDNAQAKATLDYLNTIQQVSAENSKVAYVFAAIPARYMLENKLWRDAANTKIHAPNFPWKKFPWPKANFHFARLLGDVHTGHLDSAKNELAMLQSIYDTLAGRQDMYKANQIQVQVKAGAAWILLAAGKKEDALRSMTTAAESEDATEKSPISPGEVLPAREQLGDMLMQLGEYKKALVAYEADLTRHARRFNGIYGAGFAAEKAGDTEKARLYYAQLIAMSVANSPRTELTHAKIFIEHLKA